MDGSEEMIGPQRHGHFFHDAVVDQHRTEERGLGLDIGGKRANVGGLGGEDGRYGQEEEGGAGEDVYEMLKDLLPSTKTDDQKKKLVSNLFTKMKNEGQIISRRNRWFLTLPKTGL
jgi:hypothetical protein